MGYYCLVGDEVHIDQIGWQCELFDLNNESVGGGSWYATGDLDDPLPEPVDYTFTGMSTGCYTFSGYDAVGNGLVDYSLTEWGTGSEPTIYYPRL